MPFLHAEHALLGARRACSQTQLVIFWFLVSYALYLRWHFPLTLRIIGSVICKGFLRHKLRQMQGDGRLFSHAGEFFLSQSTQSSRSFFAHSFEPTEHLRHTENTEAFQLTLAVTFCEIGWLDVSVEYCVFCSSVSSVRNRTYPLDEIRPMRLAGEVFLSQNSQI